MYGWLNQHLGLGMDEPVLERDFVPLAREEATVWTPAHPAPPRGEAQERAVTTWWTQDTDRQLAAIDRVTPATLGAWREVVGGAVAGVIGDRCPAPRMCWCFEVRDAGWRSRRRDDDLSVQPSDEQVSVDLLEPQRPGPDVVVWTSAEGRAGAATEAGQPIAVLQALLDAGRRVVVIDVFGQGTGREATGSSKIARRRPTPSATTRRWSCNARTTRWPRFAMLARWLDHRPRHAGGPRRPLLGVGRPGTRPCRRACRRGGVCHRRVPFRLGDRRRGCSVSARRGEVRRLASRAHACGAAAALARRRGARVDRAVEDPIAPPERRKR